MTEEIKRIEPTTFQSVSLLTGLGIINSILGLTHTVVVARLFGTTRDVEIYFAAFALLMVLTCFTQSYLFSDIFLPVYQRLKHEKGNEYAFNASSVVINWVILLIVPLWALLSLISEYILKIFVPGFGVEDHVLGGAMLRFLLPMLLLSFVNNIIYSILNAERQFGKPEIGTAIAYILRIITVLILYRLLNVWALIFAVIIWFLTKLISVIVLIYRLGYRHRWILRLEGFQVKKLFLQLKATFVSQIGYQIYIISLNSALSFLPQGIYAVFKYVQSIYDGTSHIVLWPINRVFFTEFSSFWIKQSSRMRLIIKNALARTFGVCVLAAVVTIVSIKPVLYAIFLGAKFEKPQVDLASLLIVFLIILLFIEGLYLTISKVIISLGNSSILFLSLTVAYLLNAVITRLIIPIWGVNGLILTRYLFYFSITAIASILLLRIKKELFVIYPFHRIKKWILSAGGGIVAGYIIRSILPDISFLSFRMGLLLEFMLISTVALIITLSVAWLSNIYEVRKVIYSLVRKVRI